MKDIIKHIAGKALIGVFATTAGFLAGARIGRSFWAAVIIVVTLVINDFFVLYEDKVFNWIESKFHKTKKTPAVKKKPTKKKTTKKQTKKQDQTAPPSPTTP